MFLIVTLTCREMKETRAGKRDNAIWMPGVNHESLHIKNIPLRFCCAALANTNGSLRKVGYTPAKAHTRNFQAVGYLYHHRYRTESLSNTLILHSSA